MQAESASAVRTDPSATQRAYEELRRRLVTGELRPGEKLKIDRLRAALNTGASPVREALSLLTSDHLVERIDQRGFRAAETSQENFQEILTLRCALEDMALRQSIANRSEAWEENLVLAHHRMTRAPRAETERFETAHRHFHMALLGACRSPVLIKFCGQLYDLNIRYRYLAGRALDYRKRDIDAEHAGIMAAAIAGDADLACARLSDHYRKTGAFLDGLLEDLKRA